MLRRLFLFVAVLPFLVACHDYREDILPSTPPICLSEAEITISLLGRYYTVAISNVAQDDSVVTAIPSADWVDVDELTSSSIRLYVHPNDEESRRTATVNISTTHGSSVTLNVTQLSEADADNNALPTGDALTVQGRVGFGYDLMCDYMDVKSATELVFDYNALLLAEMEYGTIVAQDSRNRLDYTLHTAYSIAEMAENLMSEQTDGVKFFGLSRKMTKYKSVQSFQNRAQSYGFAKISKIVATRYIDMGKIDALIREGRTDIFTDEFRNYYEAVLRDPSENAVECMVRKYGTHIVTYADLGGRLEYTINFQAEQVSRDEMEATMKYKNGILKNSDSDRRKEQLSNISSTMDVTVYGGSPETRETLQKASPTDDTNQQIPKDLLAAWTNTIVNNSGHQENLAMANCRLTPIWQLFPQENARNAVLSYILRMSENLVLSPQMRESLGISGYRSFKVDNLKPDGFGTGTNATLVKVAYVDKIPMLEICNEYVPQIRGDKRVTVIYPIIKQRSNIRRGIFPGNGENSPCEISFDDNGGCYVAQIEGYNPDDILDSLFYIDGALYPTSMNVPVIDVSGKIDMTEQILVTGYGSWLNYRKEVDYWEACYTPIVKIGPGYWGRNCIRRNDNSIIFAPLPGIDSYSVYGPDWSPYSQNEEWWYYPGISDKDALVNYIGNNVKALFKGGQSGLNTECVGSRIYGRACLSKSDKDELQIEWSQMENEGDCSIMCLKSRTDKCTEGTILLIRKDYTITEIAGLYSLVNNTEIDWEMTRRESPVYPFHGTKYNYPYK